MSRDDPDLVARNGALFDNAVMSSRSSSVDTRRQQANSSDVAESSAGLFMPRCLALDLAQHCDLRADDEGSLLSGYLLGSGGSLFCRSRHFRRVLYRARLRRQTVSLPAAAVTWNGRVDSFLDSSSGQ